MAISINILYKHYSPYFVNYFILLIFLSRMLKKSENEKAITKQMNVARVYNNTGRGFK